jgi:hypothetical protein
MNLVNNLKDLNISLEDLYECKAQINIKLSENNSNFWVVLKDRNGYDCKISSFGSNIFVRTKKGLNYQKYDSLATLQREIKKTLNTKIENVGKIQFYLETETIMTI